MWKNYFKTAFRNLWKNRLHAIVNLTGLSLGIAGCLVLGLYVRYHTTFEEHIPGAENIYRFALEFEYQGELVGGGFALIPSVDMVREEVPQMEVATLVDWVRSGQIGLYRGAEIDRLQVEDGIYYVDQDFFDVFDFEAVAGDLSALSENPEGAIISQSLAETWYGSANQALGQSFLLNDADEFYVVGILPDPPAKTDLDFQILLPTAHRQDFYDSRGWGYFSTNIQCFYRMKEGQDASLIPKHLQAWIEEENEHYDGGFHFQHQAVTDIHNNDKYEGFTKPVVTRARLSGLMAIALILVLTACINFVNLSTALAVHRAKEVGIRKTLGSARRQLVAQFLGETALIVILAVMISLVLAELALVELDALLGAHIRILNSSPLLLSLFLGSLIVLVVAVSGVYPAYVMSGFQPVKALKEAPTRMSTGKITLRKGLVVTQFAISQVMIIATVVVILQTRYAATLDLGMDPKAKMVVAMETDDLARMRSFQDAVKALPNVQNVSLSSSPAASDNVSINSIAVNGEEYSIEYLSADEHFMEVYDLELVAGEGLIRTDSATRVVINEAAVRRFGISSPEAAVGQVISWSGRDILITGVMKDFHIHSIRQKIDPLAVGFWPDRIYAANVSIVPGQLQEATAGVQALWDQFFPEYIMSYRFQDDLLAEFYATDRRLSQMFQLFSLLAILIGCLGLYGLSSFLITRKAKEIGVRKVLGASVQQILWIFSREYLVLIAVGFVLAVPISLYAMQQWLADFQYRISLSWYIFLSGIGLAMVVALFTVGFRSWHAARANPVNSLKYE